MADNMQALYFGIFGQNATIVQAWLTSAAWMMTTRGRASVLAARLSSK